MKPVSAENLEKAGQKAYQKGALDEALEAYRAARSSFEAENNQLKAAEMANNLCVILLQKKQPEEALEIVTGTESIFLNASDRKRAAYAYGNLASALEACGQIPKAESAYRTAMEIFSDMGEDEALSQTAQSLSQLLLKQGRSLEALSSMQAGIDGKKKKLSLKDRILRRLLRIPSDQMNR
ncbi:MAG: tetratricopeptide repeat protein [Anaerolineales bacterium]|nr:tetratricopeptide repeat protein [Anaerolineales bacterium]